MKKTKYLFYVRPVMSLGLTPRRYIRLTPDQAMNEAKKDMYKTSNFKGIVKITMHDPEVDTLICIFVEHPQIAKLSVEEVYEEWAEWVTETAWQAGYDDFTIEETGRAVWNR